MEPAMKMALVGVPSRLTAWDVRETCGLHGFWASRKPVFWLEAFPTAGGIPDSRSATSSHNLIISISMSKCAGTA